MLLRPKLLFLSLAFGSIRPTLISCSGCGKENPRNTIALTMVNWVVAPPMPRPSTSTARKQKILSLNKTRSPTRTSWRKESRIIMNFSCLFVNDPAIAQLNHAFAIRGILLGVRDLHDGHALLIQLAEELH